MNTLRLLWIVLTKELRDGIRDRRSVLTPLLVAAMMPMLYGFMFTQLAGSHKDGEEIKLPVAGAEYAPAMIDWLKQQSGVEIVAAPADPERAVRDRKEDVVLIIEKDFQKNLARALPAEVRLVSDSTREKAQGKVKRARTLVQTYSGELASLRLIARGVAPSVAFPLRVQDVEVTSAQERLAILLNVLPLALVLSALTGGMSIAIDTTAGERERQSLEPLLLNPVPRGVLAAGKWLAATAFGWGAVIFSMLLTINVLRRVPWQDLGIRFRVSDGELLSLLALVLPLALFLNAVMLLLATFARSFKEAQGYSGILVLVPMLPGVLGNFYPLSNRPWLAPVPILGQYALAADVLGGKPPAVAFYVLAGASVTVCAAVLLALTARYLKKEAIVFGR